VRTAAARRSAAAASPATPTPRSTTTPAWPSWRFTPDEKSAACAGFLEVLPRPRSACRKSDHRQRLRLPQERCFPGNRCGAQRHTEVHSPALPVNRRESRAPQPHPRHRMGLQQALYVERSPHRSLANMAQLLQPEQTPPRHRRPLTDRLHQTTFEVRTPRAGRCLRVRSICGIVERWPRLEDEHRR
jgi:hypothetical protein